MSGVAITAGQYSVTVEATDSTGVRTIGPTTFNVVERTSSGSPPQISLPEIVVGEATSSAGGNVTFDDGGASCSRPSGSFFPMGTTNDTCSASNGFGTTTISFVVVVTDSVAPEITVPADIFQESSTVTYTATATDNIDGAITSNTNVPYLICSPASGSTFPAGDTNVQCVAADRHFNFARASFKVTISTGVPPPALFLPGNTEWRHGRLHRRGEQWNDYLLTRIRSSLRVRNDAGQLLGHQHRERDDDRLLQRHRGRHVGTSGDRA